MYRLFISMYRLRFNQSLHTIKALYYIDSDFHSVEIFRICLGALPLQVDNFFNNGISTKAPVPKSAKILDLPSKRSVPYSRRQLEDCQAHH